MDISSISPRVLVVDDDVDVLGSLERGLRLSGFEVATAREGLEALRCVSETRPDAIVMDIGMPVLTAVRLICALRDVDSDVPVCVLSAPCSVDDRIAGLERLAPTTTWSSLSRWHSWWHGSRRCCVAGAWHCGRRRASLSAHWKWTSRADASAYTAPRWI